MQAIIISCLLGAVSILYLTTYDPMKTPKTEKKEMKLLNKINSDVVYYPSTKIYALMKSDKLPAVSIAQPKFMSPIAMQKARCIRYR